MHSNKTGNKSHRPILLWTIEVDIRGEGEDSPVNDFGSFFTNLSNYVFYYCHVISD